MYAGHDQQPLSYDVRLPDEVQADALHLLDSGKLYINGWKKSVTLRSSYATPVLLRLCS